MKEKLPPKPTKEKTPKSVEKTKKTEEATLKNYWENVLKDEGLGVLTEELEDENSTPKSVAVSYAGMRRSDKKLANETMLRFYDEGQHAAAARAIAKRFNISEEQAREIVDEELGKAHTQEKDKPLDLWRRFRDR